MKVRVISVAECVAAPATVALIQSTAEEMGLAIDLERIIVRTRDEARQYRHIGSPTVHIDGIDIEPAARNIVRFGLGSRRYGVSPTPPAELIRLAFINTIIG